MANIHRVKQFFKSWWRLLIIALTPLILLPLPIVVNSIQAKCAYVVLLLTIYWVFEVMPYAVTSLLPLAFFPMAGVISGDEIGHNYFKDISTLFLGSMILAHAMEHVQLHRRLALFVLKIVGSSVKWSMAGLMIVTAFLSMWINNSAATSIMIPAAIAIIDEFKSYDQQHHQTNQSQREPEEILSVNGLTLLPMQIIGSSDDDEPLLAQESCDERAIELSPPIDHRSSSSAREFPLTKQQIDYKQLKTGFLISVAYSAAVGGMGTLVGTGPNIFVKGFTDQFYSNGSTAFEVSFANFTLFAFPMSLVLIVLCWFWLQLLLFQWRKVDASVQESQKHVQSILKQQYKALGSMSWQEGTIIILFFILLILWVTRDFSNINGWSVLFRKEYVTDGTAALLIGSLPLILPNKNPLKKNWDYNPILEWSHLSKVFPWGVFMLQGAGLAIADGFKKSDLSSTIATFLQFIVGTSRTVTILIVIIVSAILTEFTSNLACASILFPILDGMAKSTKIHPAYLIMSSCMGVSLSLMLPIATPPNAMIFASGDVRIRDLIRAGVGFKIIGILVIFLASVTVLAPIFRIH
ncbi:unnamed protein product [Rotaria socialis]|uniref:Uncharacterized protein n=1 Tax=Rotaria socialis TaxID=392032 RepID=A0A820MDT2_9BILA|nr:unnamed protein product [Rotaria socialis]CAF4295202.1 unnamed protein product [Rotaria socialis]CAF4371500.1 unnamed protein product [Rotaria socialis]